MSIEEVLLDRALLSLLDNPEVDWEDEVPDLNDQWAPEELSPEVKKLLF